MIAYEKSNNRTTLGPADAPKFIYDQGCKIPVARSHLQVKCSAGRVKVLTICVVLF